MRALDWSTTPLGPTEAWPERFKAVVELMLATPTVASVVCEDERILLYNDAASALVGARHPSSLGRPLFEAFPELEPELAGLYDRAFRGEPVHVPAHALDAGAEGGAGDSDVDAYLTPVRVATGDVRWVHASGFVTPRDAAASEGGPAPRTRDAVDRARAEQALRAIDQRKDEFLATLAHELRNPLAPIRHALELMRDRMPDATAVALHDTVERQVEHLIRLVDDLLDVSRISRDAIRLRTERLDLRDVVGRALESARPATEHRRNTVALQLDAEPVHVDGDPVRLTQVFTDLLRNAAAHSEDGGPIAVVAARDGGDAVVRIRDHGVGIAPGEMPKLFRLFGRVEPAHPGNRGGLGIGLHLAQRLLRMHGGTVGAASDGPGSGSTVTVRLPLAADDGVRPAMAPTAPSGPERPLADDGARPLAGHRILVVDDNRDAAEMLAILLDVHGAEVRVLHDGESALASLERSTEPPPTTVLLDIGLPGLDGHAVARRIRADRRCDGTRLVALTGWGQPMDVQRSADAGFDDHLTKPVSLEVLLQALGTANG